MRWLGLPMGGGHDRYAGLLGRLDGILSLGSGEDVASMGADDDIVRAGQGDDIVRGNDGDDALYGSGGLDRLFGGAGEDVLRAGSGDDLLDGGVDDDRLAGGEGADVFRFGLDAGNDVIVDCELGIDRLDLRALGTGFAEVADAAVDGTSGALIDLGALGGLGELRINGVEASDLSVDDFLL
ncbi:calcium-binding protein [Algicella marina]|uniref:Calcium-binding protein n=1 Tax=Algicella marina TaxID=2683284 RepID=A0A6P1SYM9_9RHOB|nr:calcium-binding protein [Algicella marina]QHQ34119.1 calcium-binding protein [Algicella marina]